MSIIANPAADLASRAMMDRRSLLALTAAGGLSLATGCRSGTGGAEGEGSELTVSWYGGAPVHEAMDTTLEGFQDSHPDIAATGSGVPFGDYWAKLATETAASSPPDVFRMSMTYFVEYASRGALMDLGSLSTIDSSTLDEDVRNSGLVDGKMMGIGQSSIAPAVFSNQAMIEGAGGEVPSEWTWDEFRSWTGDFATDTGTFGTSDLGGNFQMFDVFARQEVGNQFAEDGSLLLTAGLLEAWFAMWQDLRQAKAAPPSDITAAAVNFETNPLSTGDAALTAGWVQQVTFFQPLVEDGPVGVSPLPQKVKGDFSGLFVKALDFWCIAQQTEHPEAAAQLVDHLINDSEATAAIGLLLGVPPTQAARDQLAEADQATRAAIAYVEEYTPLAGETPGPWPTGYGDCLSAFTRANETVGFGDATPAEAAETFLGEAEQALAR